MQLGNVAPVAYMFLYNRHLVTTNCAMWGMIGASVVVRLASLCRCYETLSLWLGL